MAFRQFCCRRRRRRTPFCENEFFWNNGFLIKILFRADYIDCTKVMGGPATNAAALFVFTVVIWLMNGIVCVMFCSIDSVCFFVCF